MAMMMVMGCIMSVPIISVAQSEMKCFSSSVVVAFGVVLYPIIKSRVRTMYRLQSIDNHIK